MPDAVSWAAVGAAVAAVAFAVRAAFVVGKLQGRVDNGLTDDVKQIRKSLVRVWKRLDHLYALILNPAQATRPLRDEDDEDEG